MVEIFFHVSGKILSLNVASLFLSNLVTSHLQFPSHQHPLPIIVCCPECSEENVTAFRVPLTHIDPSWQLLLERRRLSIADR